MICGGQRRTLRIAEPKRRHGVGGGVLQVLLLRGWFNGEEDLRDSLDGGQDEDECFGAMMPAVQQEVPLAAADQVGGRCSEEHAFMCTPDGVKVLAARPPRPGPDARHKKTRAACCFALSTTPHLDSKNRRAHNERPLSHFQSVRPSPSLLGSFFGCTSASHI